MNSIQQDIIFQSPSHIKRGSFWIKTFGCQMNVYDSLRISELLSSLDYSQVKAAEDADIIILNTCHIREKATEKVYSDLGRLRRIQTKKNPPHRRLIIVTGCIAQAEGKLMKEKAPCIDLIIGPQDIHKLGEMIRSILTNRLKSSFCSIDLQANEKFDNLPTRRFSNPSDTFVTIQEGCDKFCSFCVVPYTRGKEFSRSIDSIKKEIHQLVDRGAKEICLLGQNVNAWKTVLKNDIKKDFSYLLQSLIQSFPSVLRWQYMTSHPNEMTDSLIDLHGSCPQLIPFLHLPVQSGSNKILKAMNRRYTTKDYLSIVEKLYKSRPDLVLSSDFIIGFPEENEEDFNQTCEIAKECNFVHSFSFIYSPRPGTPAALRKNDVSRQKLSDRLLRLQDILNFQTLTFNKSFIGKKVDVLFTAPGRQKGQWFGKTPWFQSVHSTTTENIKGKILSAEVISATSTSLAADLIL